MVQNSNFEVKKLMKRVLEVNVDDVGYGGVFAFVKNIIQNIDHNEFVLDLASFEPFERESNKEFIRTYGGMVYECDSTGNFIFKQIVSCGKFYSLLRKKRYLTIHIHSDVAYKLLLYGLVGRMAGVPKIIVHSHSSGVEGRFRWLKRLLQMLAKPILSLQPFVKLACSEMAAKWMYTKMSQSNIHIIKNGIKVDDFKYDYNKRVKMRKELGFCEEYKVIGTVARFSFQKYPEKLLSVFNVVLKKKENFKLLWIGTGPLMDEIKRKAEKLKISDKIIFYGNSDKIADMYQVMDVFILTSRFEGLCIAAVEGQASGTQCLCSSGLSEETKISSVYYSIPLNDSDEVWAEKVIKHAFMGKRDVSIEIRNNGYDILQTVEKLAELY